MENDVKSRIVKALGNLQKFQEDKLSGYPVRDPKAIAVNRLPHQVDRRDLARLLRENKVRYVVMSHGDIPIAWVTTDGLKVTCYSTFGRTVMEHKFLVADAWWPKKLVVTL